MKYSHIPGTDIKISQLAVGGMSFGIPPTAGFWTKTRLIRWFSTPLT